MKTARAFGARRMPSATSMHMVVDRYRANLHACRDQHKAGQGVSRVLDPDFPVRPLHDADNDIEGLLRSRRDHDLFGLAPHGAGGLKIVANGFSQFEHAVRIGVAKVLPS